MASALAADDVRDRHPASWPTASWSSRAVEGAGGSFDEDRKIRLWVHEPSARFVIDNQAILWASNTLFPSTPS